MLLVQRNPEQRFMGGAWVFPGGAVHAGEDADHAATAVRELEEEAGIALPESTELVPFSRWITPEGEGVTIRFDTWFFAARGAGRASRRGPTAASAWTRAGSPPPPRSPRTRRTSSRSSSPRSSTSSCSRRPPRSRRRSPRRAARPVEPVMPKVAIRDGSPQVLLPGEPGYDDA